jgi:hypothetical protein
LKIIKSPQFENDDYLIRISGHSLKLGNGASKVLSSVDEKLARYYEKKRFVFAEKESNPSHFKDFIDDRPSLRSLLELKELDSTVYTIAAEKQNDASYEFLMSCIKNHLDSRPNTRRCLLRFANSLPTYSLSEVSKPKDVTCLSFIHYFSNEPRLVFRASDVGNELITDILTISEFFLRSVYEEKEYEISIYSSTAQNISSWDNIMNTLETLGG